MAELTKIVCTLGPSAQRQNRSNSSPPPAWFRERGLAVSLSYNPAPSTPLGLTARVAPSWGGQATSGAEADTRANPVDVPAHDPHSFRLRVVGDRLHWSPAPHSPVEHGDSLPEHGRRRAFPRLPLIDDGLPRRAHQRSQLRLAQAARATQRANLHIVVAWHAGPGQWRATIIWADHPPIVRPPKRPGRGGSRAGSEVAKGGPGVMGHRQPPVPGRRPQRLDVHADQQREHGKWKEFVVVLMRRQRTRACEHLRRRCSPPGIPRPVRLGRRTERRRERCLRLAQRDPALTQRAGLHDVTPCHRCRPM